MQNKAIKVAIVSVVFANALAIALHARLHRSEQTTPVTRSQAATKDYGTRQVTVHEDGRVTWVREGTEEEILTLNSEIMHSADMSQLVRTSAAQELAEAIDAYRTSEKNGRIADVSTDPDQVVVEYTMESYHSTLTLSILGSGVIRVSGRDIDGLIVKEIGTLSTDQTKALNYFASQFKFKALEQIQNPTAASEEGGMVKVTTFPGTSRAVQVYQEVADGSIWYGGQARGETSRHVLVDVTRKLLEFESFAPNISSSVSSL